MSDLGKVLIFWIVCAGFGVYLILSGITIVQFLKFKIHYKIRRRHEQRVQCGRTISS